MLSELPPLSKVEADLVLKHGNVDNFLKFVLKRLNEDLINAPPLS